MQNLPDKTKAEWQKKHPDLLVVKKLKSGKEADLYLIQSQNRYYALKVYDLTANLRTRNQYTEGKWIRQKSLRKALKQKTKVGKGLEQRLWTKREFYLLQKLREQGAMVPEVYEHTDNAILMQYLGDEHNATPRLIDVHLDQSSKHKVQAIIESSIELFVKNGIVHGDLSPYNVLWWKSKPWVIDFPQAADIRHNPRWKELYDRDMANIRAYFAQLD